MALQINLGSARCLPWTYFNFRKSIFKEFLNAVFSEYSYQLREYPLTFKNNLKDYCILKSSVLWKNLQKIVKTSYLNQFLILRFEIKTTTTNKTPKKY